MARTIIQPDGKYCVFSSIVDDFVYVDVTIDEIIVAYVEDERENIKRRVENELERMKKFGHHMTYEEALSTIEVIHGRK